MSYAIIEAPPESAIGYEGYGAVKDFWRYRGPECILEGPYETGKTRACLEKLNALLGKYKNARALMVRGTYSSLVNSAVITYEQKVLPYPPGHRRCGVEKLGKSKPELYIYPNGSVIVLGGLDNPDKFLSAEFDFVYINQAEEIPLDAYEKLVGRATGRAGNAPYSQILSDCNPDVPTHWILSRDRLVRFKSRHEDNPTLYDQQTGELTAQGVISMEALDALTGVRYKRGRKGLWAGVEGMVYEEWSRDIHLIDRFEIPHSWRRIRVVDFGYTNPFVCLWIAIDEDERMYVYRQIYMSQRTVARHLVDIQIHSRGESYETTICDHDAEDRATLAQHTIIDDPPLVERLSAAGFAVRNKTVKLQGINHQAADKRVTVGIEKMQQRLKVAGDGRPRFFVMRDSLIEVDEIIRHKFKPTTLEDEFPGYAWEQPKEGKAAKEEPGKVDDHGMDAVRYGAMYLDARQVSAQVLPQATLLAGSREQERGTRRNDTRGFYGSRT
jgi:phage terminase large subunit